MGQRLTAHNFLRRYAEFATYLSMFGVLVILVVSPLLLLSGYIILLYMWASTVGEAFALQALCAVICFLVAPFVALVLYRGFGGRGVLGLGLPVVLGSTELLVWGLYIIPGVLAYGAH